jgi:hypothetical protein
VAPTTTAPGTTLQTLYFTGNGIGDRTFTSTKPAVAPGGSEPDVDGDSKPGFTVKKHVSNRVAWSGPVTLGSHLQGTVSIDLFSAIKNFDTSEQQTISADLQVCDLLGLNCTSVLTKQWTFKPWAVGGAAGWTERQLDMGTVDTTVPLGGKLRLVITAVDRDLQIAMSGDRPSSLQVTVAL